ncbi:hypothetical protein ACN08P_23150 (plasmid) [Photobacterium leiognathi subsp. mandapamensis]|uniref:hypothetical protein n=1 Tax=Photobacterium leiognathi TaxID=553611 RepID=UPI003AF333E4
MNGTKQRYNERVAEITRRAAAMRSICIDSQFDAVTNCFISDDAARMEAINPTAIDPMFESVTESQGRQIISAAQSAIREYEEQFGCLPRDEMLAAAHKSMESMLTLEGRSAEGNTGGMMLESIGESLSTSEGVEIRAKMIGLILPTMLATATSDAVTFMPAQNDEMEIFKVYRTAGSNFGDFAKGTVIDDKTVGQYSQMRQLFPLVTAQQPDGTKKEYVFTASTDLQHTSIDIPMKAGSVSVFVNHVRVARDMDAQKGRLFGTDEAGVTYTGTIDYVKGIITVNSSKALAAEDKIDVEFEIDIETSPELIPTIDMEMDSRKLRPSQNAIAADATIQAMFSMQREYGVDLKAMQMGLMRNYLAAEKATRQLRDMNYACTKNTTFNIWCPEGLDWKLQREKLREKLLEVSAAILEASKVSGLVGLYAGVGASTAIKSLGAPYFVPAPNYRQTNKIHFAGTLFGMWKVFECPVIVGDQEILCYGRGNNHSEAGYVAGDAVAATMYNHPIGANLRSRNTLWELAYGEVHPYNGAAYFHRVTIVNEPSAPSIEVNCNHPSEPAPGKAKKA